MKVKKKTSKSKFHILTIEGQIHSDKSQTHVFQSLTFQSKNLHVKPIGVRQQKSANNYGIQGVKIPAVKIPATDKVPVMDKVLATDKGAEYLVFVVFSFPRNERKIYKLRQLTLSQFVYFLRTEPSM